MQTAYYNAKVLAPERANRLGLKVLLEPDLKGKIYWFDPRGTGTGAPFMVLVERVLGREAWRKIMVEQDPTFVSSQGASAEAVVRGKAAIAFSGPIEENLRDSAKAGLQVRRARPRPHAGDRLSRHRWRDASPCSTSGRTPTPRGSSSTGS